MELKKAFVQNGIAIPFPLRTLDLNDESVAFSKAIK